MNKPHWNELTTPILAPLLHNRTLALSITGVSIVHIATVLLGLPGWPCPLRHALGIPCPGCGLSRATVALLHNDWQATLTIHAFAPLFLLALVLIGIASVLPDPYRHRFESGVAYIERHTAITAFFLIGLVVYWIARLALTPASFFQLVIG